MTADPHARTLAAVDDPMPSGPAVIGARYEIVALLGAGGMGNVYKARDLELDEVVALKVLRPEIAGAPGAIERFRREVKLARKVTHPNVARVFDIGEQGGEKILTMELVEGEALSSLLERERVPTLARTLQIASAVVAGVGAAHAAGVVHRDLKPDNVLVGRDGRVVVTDFGIARAAVRESNKTFGGFVGTPAYMAPEQVDGSNVDERADLYAFGVMLFEMLTGELPWKGESPIALAAARLLHPPPDPRAVRPDLGARLAKLVLRCLARSPDDRFANMPDVAAALATITSGGARPSVPPPRPDAGAFGSDSQKRVAVLSFRNLGPSEHDYIAEGLTEDLIDLLSVARGLRVHSRGAVARFKSADRDPREIGRELGVQVVVDGSVRKTPGAFRINARLISVADGLQLWAKRFDGAEGEMLALNDEVARSVAQALTADLEASHARALDGEAADLYLRARLAYHQTYFTSGTAAKLFTQALERAPDDPRILSGYIMAQCRAIPDDATRSKLREDAERAVRVAPTLPEAHAALATVYMQFFDDASAVRSARRALRCSPSNVEAHDILGRVLAEADAPEAVRHLETALALEPLANAARTGLARHYALAGDWARCEALLDEQATQAPDLAIAVRARVVALWRRDSALAESLVSKLPAEAATKASGLTLRAVVRALRGEPTPLEEMVPARGTVGPRQSCFLAQRRTEAACALGDGASAMDTLAEADRRGLYDLAWLDRCPLLDVVRGAEGYAAIRARVADRAAAVVAAYRAPEA